MSAETAHVDTFVIDHLPPQEDWPEFVYDLPGLRFPERLNAASWLLDTQVSAGSNRPCLVTDEFVWTYSQTSDWVNRLAHVLVDDLGVVPGNRVLLLGYNSPFLVAAWYAVIKAGGVAVAVLPSATENEIARVVAKARIGVALCDARLLAGLRPAREADGLNTVGVWAEDTTGREPGREAGSDPVVLQVAARSKPTSFQAVATAADDPCLIAYTSGSTGAPKAVVHSHREVAAMCVCFESGALQPTAMDVFVGSAPLAFTFGLMSQACYPLHVGASVVLLEHAGSLDLVDGIERHRASMCFTVPTAYRTWLRSRREELSAQLSTLRVAVSSGESLSRETWLAFQEATGLALVNVLGSTEMLHAFLTTGTSPPRPGSLGRPIRGFQMTVLGDDDRELDDDTVGWLAVKGPSGCRYLDDPRQKLQVRRGWNLTGDLGRRDRDGYYWLVGRADGIIVSAGYNISPEEVEQTLLEHPEVRDCVVVDMPDDLRGSVVVAHVVLGDGLDATDDSARRLNKFVSARIARYKAPLVFEFVDHVPRTATGKVSRRASAHRAPGPLHFVTGQR